MKPFPVPQFVDALRAELTKIITYPGTAAAIGIAFILNAAISLIDMNNRIRIGTLDGLVPLGDIGALRLAPVYVFALIGAFATGTEFHNGQMRVTLAAIPNRVRLFAAKVLALYMVAFPSALLASSPLLRNQTVVATLFFLNVYLSFSFIAFGLALSLRRATAAFVVLLVFALLAWTGVLHLPAITKFLPHDAALSALGIPQSPATMLSRRSALAVLLVWTALSLTTVRMELSKTNSPA